MKLEEILKAAINISDALDRSNHSDLADRLDKEIIEALTSLGSWQNYIKRAVAEQNFEEVEIEIPEEEKLMLEDVLRSLQDSLKGN